MKALLAIAVLCVVPLAVVADGLPDRVPPLAQAAAARHSDSQAEVPDGDDRTTEQKVFNFVGKHQPALLKLLKFLKQRQPQQFEQAFKELARSQQRLESLSKRDSELYEIELQLWQVQSKLRLLAAELAVSGSVDNQDQLEEQLAELIQEETDQNIARYKLLKLRAEKEVQKLEKHIATMVEERDEHVAKNVKLWQNRIARQSRDSKTLPNKQ